VVAQYDDPSLRVVLEKARSERQSEQLRVQSTLATLRQLTSLYQWEEAIAFLEQQPAAVRENDALRSVLGELREVNDGENRVLRAVGNAYAALHRVDFQAARQQTEAMRRMQPPSELATRLVEILVDRIAQAADHVMTSCMSEANSALQRHDPKHAIAALASANLAKDFATPEIRKNWQTLRNESAKARLLKRIGILTEPRTTSR
jgi:hypothetical protein